MDKRLRFDFCYEIPIIWKENELFVKIGETFIRMLVVNHLEKVVLDTWFTGSPFASMIDCQHRNDFCDQFIENGKLKISLDVLLDIEFDPTLQRDDIFEITAMLRRTKEIIYHLKGIGKKNIPNLTIRDWGIIPDKGEAENPEFSCWGSLWWELFGQIARKGPYSKIIAETLDEMFEFYKVDPDSIEQDYLNLAKNPQFVPNHILEIKKDLNSDILNCPPLESEIHFLA